MYLDDSGARLDALFNSRLERGVGEEGGKKTLNTRTLCQVCAFHRRISPTSAKFGSGSAELLPPGGLSQRQWLSQEGGK